MATMPFTKDHDEVDSDADLDWWLDDGIMSGLVSIEDDGRTLRLHSVGLNDASLARARTGAGRRSLQGLRPHFDRIIADGAIHPFHGASDDEPPMMFWIAMLWDGLIDEMYLANNDVRFTREDFGNGVDIGVGILDLHADGTYAFEPADRPRP